MYRTQRNVEYKVYHEDSFDRLEFQSALSSGIENVDKVRALIFNASNPKGAVIFVHGTGQKNFEPLKYYPKKFAQFGYTTMMPVLPYHFERTPVGQKSGISFIKGTDVQLAKHFDQAVTDLMTCVDYLENTGFKKIHLMGFSFGGMVSVITMALDKRVGKGAFIVTGGNYEYITWQSVATKILRISYEENKACTKIVCNIKHGIFEKSIENFTKLGELSEMHPCFTYDPSLFAKFISPEKAILFRALFDLFIPRKSSEDLWTRLGKPKRYDLFSGHLTAHVLFKGFIFKKTLDFFDNEEE